MLASYRIEQYKPRIELTMHLRPEKNLLAAILIRAARDGIIPDQTVTELETRIARRFLSLDDAVPGVQSFCSERGFSYGFVCEHLGLCPYRVHRKLRELDASGDFDSVPSKISIINLNEILDD